MHDVKLDANLLKFYSFKVLYASNVIIIKEENASYFQGYSINTW